MATTRLIDTAVGILVGWRQCSTQAAFRELLAASERQQVPLFAMAGALVNLASRGTDPHEANRAAEREWGDQLSPAGGTHPGILHLYLHTMEMSPTPEP
ncbi:ANTAR domain-containing protein, partial [Mycobacterium asiaticum]